MNLHENISRIKKMMGLIVETSIEDYLKPSDTIGTDTYVNYLKDAGVADLITFKRSCLNQNLCGFNKNEVSGLLNSINDTWDVLADKCWECYGKEITHIVRSNEVLLQKIETLKPYCDEIKEDSCIILLPNESRMYITFDKNYEGLVDPFVHGQITTEFYNDPKNQHSIKDFHQYGHKFDNGTITLNKPINNLDSFVELIKKYKTPV